VQVALAANNLYHPLTYEGAVDLDSIDNPVERAGLEAQVSSINFYTGPFPITNIIQANRRDTGRWCKSLR